MIEVKIGQIWERKDGRQVEVTAHRELRGSDEYELTPLGKGRKSWKWDGGIVSELKLMIDV